MSGTFRKIEGGSYLAHGGRAGYDFSHGEPRGTRGRARRWPSLGLVRGGTVGLSAVTVAPATYVQFSAKPAGAADIEGTWSDGTRAGGESGSFKGQLREGKLFVRFCSDEGTEGGFRYARRMVPVTTRISYPWARRSPGTGPGARPRTVSSRNT